MLKQYIENNIYKDQGYGVSMVGKRGFIYEANLLKMQTQISMYPEQVIKKKKKTYSTIHLQ